jgi:inorganic pyrophosphatase
MAKDSTTTKTTTFKYDSYDEQGNWTQRTTFDDKGKATKVIKRTHTYYKKD